MNRLEISNNLSWNFSERDGKFWFAPELPLPCQKKLVEGLRNLENIPDFGIIWLYLAYAIIVLS